MKTLNNERSIDRLKHWRWDIALAICISATLGILLASEIGHRELARGYAQGAQAINFGARLQELSARLADAEASERSFVLSWDDEDLERYRRVLPTIGPLMEQLRSSYAERADTQAELLLAALARAVSAKLAEIDFNVHFADRTPSQQAIALVRNAERRRTSEEIRGLLDDLGSREEALNKEASGKRTQMLDFTRGGMDAVLALNVVLLIWLLRVLRKDWDRAHARGDVLAGLVRERTQQLDHLACRLREEGETEKAVMARELHDEFGSLLTASKMDLAWVCTQLGREHSPLVAKVSGVMGMLDEGLLAKRRIVEGLRPSALEYFGFCSAARELCERIADRAGWRLELNLPGGEPHLDPQTEIILYRVLQESLTNAARHARATRIGVVLKCAGAFCTLDVRDNGVGFIPSCVRLEAQGLFGMRHRVEAGDGHFRVDTQPNCGTQINIQLPLAPKSSGGSQRAKPAASSVALTAVEA